MKENYLFALIALLTFLSFPSFGQESERMVKGKVIDSVSVESLPYVNIRIKNTERGAASNIQGQFEIMAFPHDTLVFSFIGYYTRERIVPATGDFMLVQMREEPKMLSAVNVYGSIKIKGMKGAPYNPYRMTFKDLNSSSQLYGVVPSFGPNLQLPLGFGSKESKELRKLQNTTEKQEKVKTYVEVVNDPATKQTILEKYPMSDKEYYDILVKFNQSKGSIVVGMEPKEIMNVLLYFYRDQTKPIKK